MFIVKAMKEVLIKYSNLQQMSAKREVSKENRKFNSNWQEKYFFANNNGKPHCLLRLQLISIPKGKSFYLKNHYSTKREKPYGTYHGNLGKQCWNNWSVSKPATTGTTGQLHPLKEKVRYPVWTCRDPLSLVLGTQLEILGTRIRSLKDLKKTV